MEHWCMYSSYLVVIIFNYIYPVFDLYTPITLQDLSGSIFTNFYDPVAFDNIMYVLISGTGIKYFFLLSTFITSLDTTRYDLVLDFLLKIQGLIPSVLHSLGVGYKTHLWELLLLYQMLGSINH